VISAAIDKYVYITLHETFQREYLIKYSSTEVVQTIDEIKHPIIREALRLVPVAASHPGDRQHVGHPGGHRARVEREFHGGGCCARSTP